MKLSIEERITESGLFSFDDGYLGSTNHGVCYYQGRNDVNDITNESDLMSLGLGKEFTEFIDENDKVHDWNEFFNKWFSDCDDFEIIEDNINGGNGYGKIVVDKKDKWIKIMVVPCLYNSDWGSSRESDIKIFGFKDNGELVREISDEKLNKMLEDDYYIG
jgi:hypothetical protein